MTLALIFPGQGSQSLGMLAELAADSPIVVDTFAEASEELGKDLWQITQADEATLNQTAYTQPALLAASIAMFRIWQAEGGAVPSVMAGHSLGEYSALVAAGALKFSDAIRLVNLRGEFMQSAVPPGKGAMAAVLGLDDADVVAVCDNTDGIVSAVNFNSPGQVVIAGEKAAVEAASAAVQAAGARKVVRLPVSVPSHCELMKPAAEKLAAVLSDITIKAPAIPVIHNVDVATHDNTNAICEALITQLYQPVRWTETVQKMVAHGVTQLVECGPGKVLAGLNKRISREHPVANFNDLAALRAILG